MVLNFVHWEILFILNKISLSVSGQGKMDMCNSKLNFWFKVKNFAHIYCKMRDKPRIIIIIVYCAVF